MSNDASKLIAQQNDRFRSNFGILPRGDNLIIGKYMLSQGVSCLPFEELDTIVTRVRSFKDFNESNDPYGEHDFGKFSDCVHDILWKIDYYDINYEYGSPDPSDPQKTRRVLTVMLAFEY